jgi:co-chaperonin GroES (HSP10)
MNKISRAISFGDMMKWRFLFCLFILSVNGYAQEKTVSGIVFDKNSKDRIAGVDVRNITTGQAVYDNLKGEFKIDAKTGDRLVFTKQEFLADTLRVVSNTAVAVYLTPSTIRLKQVTIHDTLLSPEKRLAATKLDYSKIYGSLSYSDFLTSPSSGGAGISIDALYNSISKSGRNAEHLRQIIEKDYQQNVIDYRFNRTTVGSITGLKDEKLTEFMQRYRPGYYLTKTATDYEFIASIKANYKRFVRNPRRYSLQSLKAK